MNMLKIRASQLSRLMTEPKLKADKDAGNLSETAKTMIEEIWLKDKYGYREVVSTDAMMKGLLCEQDILGLIHEVVGGEFRVKNTELFQNDFIIGTPDIILKKEDYDEDAKASFNLRTFFEVEHRQGDNYWWQGQAYMWLTGKKNYRLIFGLVPTPESLITSQKKRVWYQFECDEENEDYIKASMQIEHNNKVISEIPAKERVKVFEFAIDNDAIEQVKIKHAKAVEYYNQLTL